MTPKTPSALVLLDRAKLQIEKAKTVQEVKGIRDKAEVMRQYQKLIGAGLENQNQCAEIKLRAERKAGALLADDPEIGSGKGDTLSLLGVSKKESSRWQAESAVPDEDFEAFLLGFQHLRMAFRRNLHSWRKTFKSDTQKTIVNGVECWKSRCVFVPVSVVLDAITQVCLGTSACRDKEGDTGC